jgi:hypothetical protein
MSHIQNWKRTPTWALVLLVGTVLAAHARAQSSTVVDDFTVTIPPINVDFVNTSGSASSTIAIGSQVNVQRLIQESVILGGAAAVAVSGGNYSLTATDAQDTTNFIAYSNFTIDATEQHFLRFDLNAANGLDQLVLNLGNGALPMVNDLFSVPDSAGPFSFFVDLSLIPEWTPAFASGVDNITIVLGSSSDTLMVNLNEISFTSVPEPSPWALLVCTGALVYLGRKLRDREGRQSEA